MSTAAPTSRASTAYGPTTTGQRYGVREPLAGALLERNDRQLQRCDVSELQRVRNDQQCRAILGLHRTSAPIEVLRKSFEKVFAGVATALDGFILRANMASDHD
jgi:hypothetical protein